MATANKSLSSYDEANMPAADGMRIGIAVSAWNKHITENLYKGAYETLCKHGVIPGNIIRADTPGSFELSLAAKWLLESKQVDAVICLGSVIRGETPHFDFVCSATAHGVQDVALKTGCPVIFGVLTDNTEQQALDRSGGKHGNKGVECAAAAIHMLALKRKL